jgi:ribose 5-phosphate isomerase A
MRKGSRVKRVSTSEQLEWKRLAAERAALLVEDGMMLGLGSGSTAEMFVRALAPRVAAGLHIQAVASSTRTERLAREIGIELIELAAPLDLAVDGADVIERGTLNAIKGLGGALTREKLIALAARRFVLIGDVSKCADRLADHPDYVPVPVEVLRFGWQLTCRRLEPLGRALLRQRDGATFITDNGNVIVDLFDADLTAPEPLARAIDDLPGVVMHGLFLGIAETAIVAGAHGVEVLGRGSGPHSPTRHPEGTRPSRGSGGVG